MSGTVTSKPKRGLRGGRFCSGSGGGATTACCGAAGAARSHARWLPQVAGDKIVWVDHRNDATGYRLNPKNSDIYIHDLSTGKTTAVTTHSARQEEPDVHGDWVVWQDYRDAPDGVSGKEIDIWAKNMATGKEYQVTDYPRIRETRPIWKQISQ